ncbi:hypothetical protein X975_13205, partial [Stegodyphus mimosarum]
MEFTQERTDDNGFKIVPSQTFVWTKECENTFKNLKEALTSAPILTYPQLDRSFIPDMGASNESVGAVLSQEIEGRDRIVVSIPALLRGRPVVPLEKNTTKQS